uniref:Putative reverse transcriptase domain-containing protein n=1 Tax=Tanacetum cinerariifolium TaxID=118510 RepID=A0A699KX05_TANCI|nr:putative reverse transcriptase domain-containing protein [Tanacetum cinerariifolium]
MLCDAPILVLPEGTDDFVVYYDASNQGKASVVADALSKKEWLKLRHDRAMSMKIHSSIKAMILEAQIEASKDVKSQAKMLKGLDKKFERKEDGGLILEIMTESIRNATGFEYCLPSSYRWSEILIQQQLQLECEVCPFEALYGRRCRTPIAWAEVGESKLLGLEIIQETTDKIVLIKKRLKMARDRQKSSANNWRKPLEFSIGPFEIVERVGPVAYRLCLPQELIGIHDSFHVSDLKKCLADENLHLPLEEIKIDDKLRFVEEPIEILDREVKKLKQSWIPIVKVRWNSRLGLEFTW